MRNLQINNKNIKTLVEKYQKIRLLTKIRAVLEWDLNVCLPEKAAVLRGEQSSFIAEELYKLWTEKEFLENLERAKAKQEHLSKEEKAVLRFFVWAGNVNFKVPKEIILEKTKTTSEAFIVWRKAKQENKFADFLPILKKIIDLELIIAKYLGFEKNPYDALLNTFEPNLTFEDYANYFKILKPEIGKLLANIKKSPRYQKNTALLKKGLEFRTDHQRQMSLFILRKMGYDLKAGRLDTSAHPITFDIDRTDTRITSWYHESDFRKSYAATLHEGGHALYGQGVNEVFDNTPLENTLSLGIHESQSRFWENIVGKTPAFLKFLTPILQAFHPDQLGEIGEETIIRLLNDISPGPIRVEADEITYNLHILLRFEIENDLINRQLDPEDLPRVWKTKTEELLQVKIKNDREGVLQDVHWSMGAFGYFPSYTLGNLYAAQIAFKMKKELPFEELLSKGELGTVLSWLRENIHRYGSLYRPDELILKVTGEPLNPGYFLDYLKEKYSAIYAV